MTPNDAEQDLQQPTITLRTDRKLIRAGARSVRYLVVDVQAPPAPSRADRMPVNVALVLDRSGSMDGERKFDLAREAVEQAFRMMGDEDRVSLITYDDRIDVVLRSAPATERTKREALAALARVAPRGSTDLCSGWMHGCEQVAEWLEEGTVSRVLLLTDGLANHGTTDRPTLARHAAELRARGVTTSTFGVGADFDELLLRDMAEQGGGNFYFIESPAQIADLMTSELGEALDVVVRGAALELVLPAGADAMPLNRFRHDRARRDALRVELGDLVSNQSVQVAVRIEFARGTVGAPAVLDASLVGMETRALVSSAMEWTYAEHADVDRQPRNRTVDRVVAALYAARARLEANDANRRGDFARARRVLEGTARRIREYAGTDAELRDIARGLRDEVSLYADAPMAAMALKMNLQSADAFVKGRDAQGRARRMPR